jgi:hypothetical protein
VRNRKKKQPFVDVVGIWWNISIGIGELKRWILYGYNYDVSHISCIYLYGLYSFLVVASSTHSTEVFLENDRGMENPWVKVGG